MNRSRVLILLGILLLVGALAVLVIFPQVLANSATYSRHRPQLPKS